MIRFLRRQDRHAVAALLAWLICSALYLWTANGVVIDDGTDYWHHYEYLVDGFLSGHLHLSVEPPKELLGLADPYDPKKNAPYRLWDASLYHGHYYLYFGPTPALLLMLPWKAVTGHHLPQRLATGAFGVLGLGALALLLAGVRRRHFPAVSPTALFLAVLLVGHVTWLPVILRRPAFWELPIVTAAALFWWSLYFFWRHHDSAKASRWALATGVALALVIGARPTFLFSACLLVLLFALPFERSLSWAGHLRRLLPAGIPLAMGIGALLAYNYARFGSFLEFGQRYQLWGPTNQESFVDERFVRHFSPAYFPFNARCYFFSVPDLSVYFPFVHTATAGQPPAGYIATEEVYGLLFSMPAQLFAGVALMRAWRGRNDFSGRSLHRLVLVALLGSVFAAAILFCFAGACSRYIVELVAGWSVITGFGFLAVFEPDHFAARSGVLRLLGAATAVWSMIFVWLASYDFRSFARITQPVAYPIIAGILDYPSYWAARSAGQQFGPVALDVHLATNPDTGSAVLLGAGSESMMNRLIIERTSSTELRLRLTANAQVVLETPSLRSAGSSLHIECAAPWLYPPAAHPYWHTAYPDEPERRRRQTLYAVTVNGAVFARPWLWGFDATRFGPDVRTVDAAPPACAWVDRISRPPTEPAPVQP
jgi:hypothetical protein